MHFARQIKVIPIKISYNIRTKSEICKPGGLLIFVWRTSLLPQGLKAKIILICLLKIRF